MSLKPSRAILHVALICMAVAAGVLWLRQSGALQRLELLGFDDRVKMERAGTRAPDQVAVILIDEASLRAMNPAYGRYPWPRSVYAELLGYLALGSPQAVVFDLLFSEDEKDAAGAGHSDRRLAAATGRDGPVFHAAQFFNDADGTMRPLPPDFVNRFAMRRASVPDAPGASGYALPIAPLYRAAAGVGVADLQPDGDGVYRRVHLFYAYDGAVFPGLSAAALPGLRATPLRERGGLLYWRGGAVPVDTDGTYLVKPYGHIATYSFGKLYADLQASKRGDRADVRVDPRVFAHKIVFIGTSAAALGDLKPTALSMATPGVMLHAAAAANLLTGDFLHPAAPYVTVLLVTGMALLTGIGIAPARRTPYKILLPLALASVYMAWVYWRFRHGTVYDLSAPLLAVAGAWLGVSLYGFVIEGRDKQRLREAFAQYLSPALLQDLAERNGRAAAPGRGRRERVTVLFSDIRGFTSISERLDAEKVVELLNIHFRAMADVVFAHGGTLDKFIGDALMAYWGAPAKRGDHALQAVTAALEMHRRLDEVNRALAARGYPTINIGVGVHTGEVILGHIGSEKKLDFTVVGDNVNTASRLEGLSARYGQTVIVSDATYAEVCDAIPCAVLDKVKVKGKDTAMLIYTPLAGPEDRVAQRAAAAAAAERINAAFRYYLARDWRRALDLYRGLPHSDIARAFAARCAAYLERGPAAEWDGTTTYTVK